MRGVYAEGMTVYAATDDGLAISTNGGTTFSNKTTANSGLGNNTVSGVYAVGSTVYAATNGGGLSISTNGGATFINKTTTNGLGDNNVRGVYVVGATVYVATSNGLAISTNGGTTFSNRTTANSGLGNNTVRGVYAVGATVYAATSNGLAISTDGGTTFTNRTTTNGLGNNVVYGVYAEGTTVYAATQGGLSFCPPAVSPLTLALSANPDMILTTGTTTLSATVSGGTTPYSYTFSGPGTISQMSTSNTATVSGLPAGVQTFTVVARDATTPTSQTISGTVNVTVTQANTPPVAASNANQTATVGVAFSYAVNAFTDNTPNSLTYTASIDPANGFSFDPVTRVISGIPGTSGVSSVTIVATDPGSLSASTTFTITVSPALPIRYVTQNGTGDGSSWANASGNLQAMIDAPGVEQVWVAGGLYKPTPTMMAPRDASFRMKNSVAIYGGFVGTETNLTERPAVNPVIGTPSSTTLSGDIGTAGVNSDNSHHVINNEGNNLNSTARLDGFVITGGNANGTNSESDIKGGGIYNNNSSPTLTNCNLVNNSATRGGGIFNSDGDLTLVNCNLQNNTAASNGGGIYNSEGGLTLINCSLLSNSATNGGGGLFNNQSSPPRLTNCNLQNNSATNGGGIYNQNSSPTLTNCSLFRNSATSGGGIYNASDSNPKLANCVLWDNGGNKTISYEPSSLEVSTSTSATFSLFDNTVTGYNTNGEGNKTTTTSPFASANSVDLAANSPAINAGSNAAYSSAKGPDTDLVGNPRFFPKEGTIDMGAIESLTTPVTALTLALSVSPNPVCAGNTATLSVTALGGSTPYSYTWTAPAGIMLSGNSTPTVSASVGTGVSGVQTFTITVADASASTSLVSLAVNAAITATLFASPSNTLTGGLATTLVATGGSSYVFSGPGLLSQDPMSGTATANQPGTYSVIVTNATGCTATTTLTLLLPQPLFTGCGSPTSTIGQALQIVAPVYDCTTGIIRFRTVGGDGSAITYSAIGITSGTSSCTARLDAQVAQDIRDQRPNVQPFTLVVNQSGQRLTYSWDALAACAGQPTPTNRAPIAPIVANQTARTGTFFSLTVPTFVDPDGDALTYTALGLPANGLTFTAINRSVSGTPSATGLLSVTVTATDPAGLSTAVMFSISVVAPVSNTVNQAPVAAVIANQSATVGQSFIFALPAFSDPNGDMLTYAISGLPANGLSVDTQTRIITGTPSATGLVSVTVVATDPAGLSATARFTIGISASAVNNGAFQLIQPLYNCQTGAFTFRTNGGTGGPIEYRAIGITGWTTTAGPYTVLPASDAQPFMLQARQNGVEVALTFDLKTFCATPNPPAQNQPPVASSVASVTAVLGQMFRVQIPRFSDPNGDVLTYTLTQVPPSGLQFNLSTLELSGTPSATGVIGITVVATDPGGLTAATSFSVTVIAAPVSGTASLALIQPLYNCQTGAFTFQTVGGTGGPIEYRAIGVTGWTNTAGPYTVLPASDAGPFTLQAHQGGVEVSLVWNWKAVCGAQSGGRSGAAGASDSPDTWRVVLQDNPPVGDEAVVVILGMPSSGLQVMVSDLMGRSLGQPVAVLPTGELAQTMRVRLGSASMIYLIGVSDGQRQVMLRVLRP